MKTASIVLFLLLSAACVAAEDGRVYVKSDPAGAEICVFKGDDKDLYTSTNQKTPALITVAQGDQKLLLKLAGYKDTYLTVKVDGAAIIKPDPVKLALAKVALDILYSDEGWSVLIDKKAVNDASGKPAIAPCTIPVPQGHHEVTLAKEGYNDMSTQVVVGGDLAVDIDKVGLKPSKGKSASVPAKAVEEKPEIAKFVAGCKFKMTPSVGAKEYPAEEVSFGQDDTFGASDRGKTNQGKWVVTDPSTITMTFDDVQFGKVVLHYSDGKLTGKNTHSGGSSFNWKLEKK